MWVTDNAKLKQRIRDKCGKQSVFAKQMGISERSLYTKLSGQSQWKKSEIIKAIELLKISSKEAIQYFFTEKVMPEELPTSDSNT